MITPLTAANLSITVLPKGAPAPELAQCGLCGRETFVTLILSDDHPCCCRHCFRQHAPQVRPARFRRGAP